MSETVCVRVGGCTWSLQGQACGDAADAATEGREAEGAGGMCGARGVRSSKVTSTKTSVFNAEGGVTQLILQGLWYVAGTRTDPPKRHLALRECIGS